MAGKKDGLHIRSAEKYNGHACWELWDGEHFVGGAYGRMSLHTVGILAKNVEGKTVRIGDNHAQDYLLPIEEDDCEERVV